MSFKWPSKDKDELLDYSIDWSRFLVTATISEVTWFVDDANGAKTQIAEGAVVNGIQNVSQTVSGPVCTINLGLGTANYDYKFTCRMEDSTGSIAERVVRLKIKEQ